MARTAKKKISVYDEGVLLVDDIDSLNFAGVGVTGTNIGTAVTETIPGGAGGKTQVFGEVVSGSTGVTFTLAHVPSGTIDLAANGQVLTLTIDYSITGAVITMVNSQVAGTVVASYQY